jgi:uncharacterized surface protein with fasciclin (FAS1) repeats
MRFKLAGAAAVAAMLVLTGCATSDTEPEGTTDETTAAEAPEDTAGEDTTGSGEEAPGTIVDVASANEDFSTLVAAVDAAGLVETLNGEGPFTVFAPTNDAFAALPEGLLDALLLPENQETLVKILTYHVLPAEVTSDQVADGEVATVEGQSVTISTADGVKVNDANVIATDVEASNGVIHVIDAVIVPPDVDPAALLG